jgi:hypothetical protein
MKGAGLRNSTFPLVEEYFKRRALAELGYTSPISSLDYEKSEVFAIIHREVETYNVKKLK